MMFRLSLAFATWLGVAAFPQAQQCPPIADDGFDVSCCTVVSPTLPDFPPIECPGDYSDYNVFAGACGPLNPCSVVVGFGTPAPVLCDTYLIPMTVTLPVAPGIFSGTVIAKYTSTFLYTNPLTEETYQIWRFVCNVDLTMSDPTGTCPIPVSQFVFGVAWFCGTIDYFCTAEGGWQVRADFTHDDDAIAHVACRQGIVDPLRHTLVCPPAVYATPEPTLPFGSYPLESVREGDLLSNTCFGETELALGFLGNAANVFCGRWSHSLTGLATCAGALVTIAPNTGYGRLPAGAESTYLGTHLPTAPGDYPGDIEVWTTRALHNYVAFQCSTDPLVDHLSHGVITFAPQGVPFGVFEGGVPFPGGQSSRFDMANNLVVTPTGLLPTFGCPSLADLVQNYAF